MSLCDEEGYLFIEKDRASFFIRFALDSISIIHQSRDEGIGEKCEGKYITINNDSLAWHV